MVSISGTGAGFCPSRVQLFCCDSKHHSSHCMSKKGGNTSSPVQLSGGSLAVWRDGNISGLAGKNDMIWWWFEILEGEIGWHNSPAFVLIVKALYWITICFDPIHEQFRTFSGKLLWHDAYGLTVYMWLKSWTPKTRDDGCWPNMFTIGTLASSAWFLGVLN